MFANINGTKIFFDVEGVGIAIEKGEIIEKPTCFVLHGGPGSNHLAYKNSLTPLSKMMQLVYVDNRGSGYSSDSSLDQYTMEQNVDDLEELRKYLGLEKIVLFGQSYGGMVAMRYAVKYPEAIEGLLLVTTSPHYSFINDAKQVLKEKGTLEQIEIAKHVWEGSFETEEQHIQFQELLAPLYSYTFDKDAPRLKRKGRFSFEALNKGFGDFLRSYDVTDEIKQLNMPTLVIGGRHDWITPLRHSYSIAELIPDSELVVFENSSHSVLKDEYDRFHSVVSDFIERKIFKIPGDDEA